MKDVIKKIFDASVHDTKSLCELALKLSEECGEVAQAVLSYTNVPGCGYKGKTKQDVLEEAWDCIITATCIVYKVEDGKVDESFSENMLNLKLNKWITKNTKGPFV